MKKFIKILLIGLISAIFFTGCEEFNSEKVENEFNLGNTILCRMRGEHTSYYNVDKRVYLFNGSHFLPKKPTKEGYALQSFGIYNCIIKN